jgi:hypothetical protein
VTVILCLFLSPLVIALSIADGKEESFFCSYEMQKCCRRDQLNSLGHAGVVMLSFNGTNWTIIDYYRTCIETWALPSKTLSETCKMCGVVDLSQALKKSIL